MNTVVNRMQVFSKSSTPQQSVWRLVLTTIAYSTWLLSKSLRIIVILHKEMLNHIVSRQVQVRPTVMNRNIFKRYGVWCIDMHGLIHEEMGIK